MKRLGIYLFETKTKSEINEGQIRRNLSFDLQTMIYLVALNTYKTNLDRKGWNDELDKHPVFGVRYNVIRRPLSGGAGTIRQHKPTKSNPRGESKEEFYARLGGIIRESPETYFVRFKVEITPKEIETFKKQTLDPILEQLCDWWDWIEPPMKTGSRDPFDTEVNHGLHWRHPFGVWNSIDETGFSDLDEYITNGSEAGLQRVNNLFPEL